MTKLQNVPTTTLKTVYPYCNGAARFTAIDLVPRETYERTCPACGQHWSVERRCIIDRPGIIRADAVTWEHN